RGELSEERASRAAHLDSIPWYRACPRLRPSKAARLRFIKHAQDLGFSLKEIQEPLGLRIRHGAACDTVARKTRAKIGLVQQKIAGLERVKRTLERLAAACAARRPTDECPILDALEDHADVND